VGLFEVPIKISTVMPEKAGQRGKLMRRLKNIPGCSFFQTMVSTPARIKTKAQHQRERNVPPQINRKPHGTSSITNQQDFNNNDNFYSAFSSSFNLPRHDCPECLLLRDSRWQL